MKSYVLSILFSCFISFGFSQNTSSIDFDINNLGINVDGHFNSFSITTKFNNDSLELESITGSITVSSIKTGIDKRDEHLLEEEYFNAKKYKQITLKSESVTKMSTTEYVVNANLRIKGITKQISHKVKVEKHIEGYKISSSFEVNRKDFEVGGGSFIMSKTVRVNVIHYEKL